MDFKPNWSCIMHTVNSWCKGHEKRIESILKKKDVIKVEEITLITEERINLNILLR